MIRRALLQSTCGLTFFTCGMVGFLLRAAIWFLTVTLVQSAIITHKAEFSLFFTSSNSFWHRHTIQWLLSNLHITSCRSATWSSPQQKSAGKYHTTGFSACLLSVCTYEFDLLTTFFTICDLWSNYLNAHNIKLKSPHVWIEKATQKSHVLPMALSLEPILSISHISNAVFQSLR